MRFLAILLFCMTALAAPPTFTCDDTDPAVECFFVAGTNRATVGVVTIDWVVVGAVTDPGSNTGADCDEGSRLDVQISPSGVVWARADQLLGEACPIVEDLTDPGSDVLGIVDTIDDIQE